MTPWYRRRAGPPNTNASPDSRRIVSTGSRRRSPPNRKRAGVADREGHDRRALRNRLGTLVLVLVQSHPAARAIPVHDAQVRLEREPRVASGALGDARRARPGVPAQDGRRHRSGSPRTYRCARSSDAPDTASARSSDGRHGRSACRNRRRRRRAPGSGRRWLAVRRSTGTASGEPRQVQSRAFRPAGSACTSVFHDPSSPINNPRTSTTTIANLCGVRVRRPDTTGRRSHENLSAQDRREEERHASDGRDGQLQGLRARAVRRVRERRRRARCSAGSASTKGTSSSASWRPTSSI